MVIDKFQSDVRFNHLFLFKKIRNSLTFTQEILCFLFIIYKFIQQQKQNYVGPTKYKMLHNYFQLLEKL